ncbi:L-arabinose transport system permease protein AraQ [Poriferisphaera corsica]|uniref:L-arabinose transport system permease protein AraQ n=1 Tax=Poriferisphaera corsica TaxID=2528020 RepID=A0A517YT84_9BACT|nr:carbohydrate ABC transporter permease [Poriferisphaera corsica]QDU33443.1 L-arabinose transport system permease protein AraQ [Poriferisphaera corsica]
MKMRRVIELGVLLLAICFFLPVLLIFVTSFKSESEILHFTSFWPESWSLSNYWQLFANPEEIPIGVWTINSFLYASTTTLIVLSVDALAAYGLARLNLPFAKIMLGIFVITMMVPAQVQLIPTYLVLNQLGWLDTMLAIVIPPASNAFGVFLLYQFFKGIPKDLEEAAALDGCSRMAMFFHIALPLSKPALATLAIFIFLGSWNDFLGPLVFLDSSDRLTLPVGIATFQSSYYSEYGLTLAAGTIATVPALIAFLVFQKSIIEGISRSGMKD